MSLPNRKNFPLVGIEDLAIGDTLVSRAGILVIVESGELIWTDAGYAYDLTVIEPSGSRLTETIPTTARVRKVVPADAWDALLQGAKAMTTKPILTSKLRKGMKLLSKYDNRTVVEVLKNPVALDNGTGDFSVMLRYGDDTEPTEMNLPDHNQQLIVDGDEN